MSARATASSLLLALVVGWVGASGPAEAAVVAAAPGGWVTGYASPVFVVEPGMGLTFINGDIQEHDVVSVEMREDGSAAHCIGLPPGGCPLFRAPLAGVGEAVPVAGVADLTPGSVHPFYCDPHPWMQGLLVVV